MKTYGFRSCSKVNLVTLRTALFLLQLVLVSCLELEVMAAIMPTAHSDGGYLEHWQEYVAGKNQAESGAKREALRSLSSLLCEKEQDLCRYKEKYEQCDKALKRTQQQLDSLLKRQYQQSPTDACAPGFPSSAAVRGQQPSMSGQIIMLGATDATASALETGSPSLTARGCEQPSPSSEGRIVGTEASAGVPSRLHRGCAQSMPALRPEESVFDDVDHPSVPWSHVDTSAIGMQQPLQSAGYDRICASLPVTNGCSLNIGTLSPIGQLAAQPTVSAGVLRNLIKENLRMKKVIDEIKRRDGGANTVSKLMEAAEADRVVVRLRHELQAKQKLIEELQSAASVSTRGDSSCQPNLATKLAALENKLEKQARSLEVKERTIASLTTSLQKIAEADAAALAKSTDNCTAELTDVEKLQRALRKREKEFLEETQLLNAQLQIYRDDFEAERLEKKRLSDDYESKVAKLTGQVSSLKAQLHTASQELIQLRKISDSSNKSSGVSSRGSPGVMSAGHSVTTAQDLWNTQSNPLSKSMSQPAYCFSSTSPMPVNSGYTCPQCHLSFSTQGSFESHINICLKASK